MIWGYHHFWKHPNLVFSDICQIPCFHWGGLCLNCLFRKAGGISRAHHSLRHAICRFHGTEGCQVEAQGLCPVSAQDSLWFFAGFSCHPYWGEIKQATKIWKRFPQNEPFFGLVLYWPLFCLSPGPCFFHFRRLRSGIGWVSFCFLEGRLFWWPICLKGVAIFWGGC